MCVVVVVVVVVVCVSMPARRVHWLASGVTVAVAVAVCEAAVAVCVRVCSNRKSESAFISSEMLLPSPTAV